MAKLSELGIKMEMYKRYVDDQNAAVEACKPVNSISPMVQLEEDIPANHASKRVPILDLEVWMDGFEAKHLFYKKSMASGKVISARSAFLNSENNAILVQECLRRLKNCS